jgi:uncharacterized protein (DUF362 family)
MAGIGSMGVVALCAVASCGNGSKENAASSNSTTIAASPPSTPAPTESAEVISHASEAYASASAEIALPPGATFDGEKSRTEILARLRSDRSTVHAITGTDPKDLGARVCEATLASMPRDKPVLLKPNLCGFDAIKTAAGGDNGVTGRTTRPEFVEGVIECLKAKGVTRITIAEGCAVPPKQFLKIAELSGFAAMAKRQSVPLVAMDDDGEFDVAGDKPGLAVAISGMEKTSVSTLMLPKVLVEHLANGVFISLPKIKAHRFSVVSLSIKGMQGVVMRSDGKPHHTQKWRMHKELMDYLKTKDTAEDRALYIKSLETFADRMLDVLEVAAPDFILAEGAPAMGGDGFGVMTPTAENIAIGGTNPVTVDQVGARFLGLGDSEKLALGLRGYRTSPLIERGAKRYGVDLSKIAIDGDGAALISAPRKAHFISMAPFTIQ